MKTVFLFFKKLGLWACLGVIVFCCAFSASLSFAEERAFSRGFYFVVIVTNKVEAAAGWSSLDGGAGYAVQSGRGVALGVYLSYADAAAVCDSAKEYYPQVEVEERRVERLRFVGAKEKRLADEIVAAYGTLYEYFRLLLCECERLLSGGTQESSKEILFRAGEQLIFLGKSNCGVDEGFASVCAAAGEELKAFHGDAVFVKDIRYFLCKYAEKTFSLLSRYGR